jgi:hypothetical protein
MAEPAETEEPRGTVDRVAVFYVLGGIPTLIAFFVILFLLVRACGHVDVQIPA